MKHLPLILITALVTISCTGGSSGNKRDATTTDSDSIQSAAPTFEQLQLPDTVFASAAAISYRIDNEDTLPHPLLDFDDLYSGNANVLAFRKNLKRNADFGGHLQGTPDTIEVAWRFDTDIDTRETRFGTWMGGTGWSGQPLYMHWSEDDIRQFRASSPGLTEDFGDEEIMIGSLCTKIYFINYKTGKASRQPIDATNVIKGTMSLDPEYKNLYVGQGVPHATPFGNMVIDLLRHSRTRQFDRDPAAWRSWGAFDSSPIVAGGYLFWPGENGSIYKYVRARGDLQRISVLRYRVNGAAPGIESSICVYRNYGYVGDNHGNILCVNLNNMRPVWYYNNLDDTDGTIVCNEENGTPYLYTACEVDKRGSHADCHFIKLNALNGERIWDLAIPCHRFELPNKTLDGGMYATPLLGTGDAAGMIFANICTNDKSGGSGSLHAISTSDGKIIYTVPYPIFAWSSPIAFHDEHDQMYIFTGDANGNVYLIRAITGEVICRQHVANNFESSPIAVGNTAIVGSRGNGIYKFIIR